MNSVHTECFRSDPREMRPPVRPQATAHCLPGAALLSPLSKATKRARTLTDAQFEHALGVALSTSVIPIIDELALLLSFFAGLRAAEIATLLLDDVTDAGGQISASIWVRGIKRGRDRQVPMHPRIRSALERFRLKYPRQRLLSPRRTDFRRQTTANALAVWFLRLYRQAGLEGCSSHSGRRTCITNLAKRANRFHNSLRDVQLIAGHARLDTTSAYIQPSSDTSAMIASLGA